MASHDALIQQARALADEKEYLQAVELLDDRLDDSDCMVAYADIAQLGSLGEPYYQKVHHAIRNTPGIDAEAYLMAGLYDALSLFDGAKPMQGLHELAVADQRGVNGVLKVVDRWADALTRRTVEDRTAWSESLRNMVRPYPHLAFFMASIINANDSPATGGNDARPDDAPAESRAFSRLLSPFAPTVFDASLKPLLREVLQMQRGFGERHWLGLTLGVSIASAKRVLRLLKEVFGGKLQYPGGFGLLQLPDGLSEIQVGFDETYTDFVCHVRPLDKTPFHEQVTQSLWIARERFLPFRCGAWQAEGDNWKSLRAAGIFGSEGIDCRVRHWVGSKEGAAKNRDQLTLYWVDIDSAAPWRKELDTVIENATLDLDHAGLPSVKRRKGMFPFFNSLLKILDKSNYEKTAAWLRDYAKLNPDGPAANFTDGIMQKLADEFPDPDEEGDTLCHVRFDGEIIEDDDAYASLLQWYFEAAREHVKTPKIKSKYDTKANAEIISFTHLGEAREWRFSHKSDWVSEKFLRDARRVVSERSDWRYVALAGDDMNLQVFMPNKLADALQKKFEHLID